jgi:hypothetical protein
MLSRYVAPESRLVRLSSFRSPSEYREAATILNSRLILFGDIPDFKGYKN